MVFYIFGTIVIVLGVYPYKSRNGYLLCEQTQAQRTEVDSLHFLTLRSSGPITLLPAVTSYK